MATVLIGAALLGALLLIVAEFTTLYSVNVAGRYVATIQTETAGSHNTYAMLPIALLAAGLALVAFRTRSRPALLALAVLGVAALLIAVLGDLPDAHAHGLTRRYQLASNSPGPGAVSGDARRGPAARGRRPRLGRPGSEPAPRPEPRPGHAATGRERQLEVPRPGRSHT